MLTKDQMRRISEIADKAADRILAIREKQRATARHFPCGCPPCPDCGASGCQLNGCPNESHGTVVNGF